MWRSDPDRPALRSPAAELGSRIREGDVITRIDGQPTLSVPDPAILLRGKAGKQVLVHLAPSDDGSRRGRRGRRGPPPDRAVVVTPISAWAAADRRYHEWEYTRRLAVEEASKGAIGYVHLRAMGADDMAAWMRAYLPIFDRQGLIVDVRHNGGGNIDSWILERLMRKAWMYWSQRTGRSPSWNMQYAFRGHMVVLVDEFTGSDGEAFAEGFRRLGLGEVIGTRTWGGEIWLTMSNVLVDGGIASAAEFGVFGPEGRLAHRGPRRRSRPGRRQRPGRRLPGGGRAAAGRDRPPPRKNRRRPRPRPRGPRPPHSDAPPDPEQSVIVRMSLGRSAIVRVPLRTPPLAIAPEKGSTPPVHERRCQKGGFGVARGPAGFSRRPPRPTRSPAPRGRRRDRRPALRSRS